MKSMTFQSRTCWLAAYGSSSRWPDCTGAREKIQGLGHRSYSRRQANGRLDSGTVERSAMLWAIPTTAITHRHSKKRSPRDQLGWRHPTFWIHSPGNAVQHVLEQPWRPVHHTGNRSFTGARISGPKAASQRSSQSAYDTIFSAQPVRLFTPVGSNITEALFFVPAPMALP